MEVLGTIWGILNAQITLIEGNPLTALGIIQVIVLTAIVLLFAGRLARLLVRHLTRRMGVTTSVASIIGSTMRGLVIFIGLYVALTSIGLSLIHI